MVRWSDAVSEELADRFEFAMVGLFDSFQSMVEMFETAQRARAVEQEFLRLQAE